MYSSRIIVFTGTVHCRCSMKLVGLSHDYISYILNSSNIISFVFREFCTDSIRTTTCLVLLLRKHLLIPYLRNMPKPWKNGASDPITPSSSSKTSTLAILPTWKTPGRMKTLPFHLSGGSGCSFFVGVCTRNSPNKQQHGSFLAMTRWLDGGFSKIDKHWSKMGRFQLSVVMKLPK